MPSRNISNDRTQPGAQNLRRAAEELLDEMPDVGTPPNRPGWGRPASIQRNASAAEQREYLRLVDDFERSRRGEITGAQTALLLAGVVGVSAFVGWIWKQHRIAKAKAEAEAEAKQTVSASSSNPYLIGADVLAARPRDLRGLDVIRSVAR